MSIKRDVQYMGHGHRDTAVHCTHCTLVESHGDLHYTPTFSLELLRTQVTGTASDFAMTS